MTTRSRVEATAQQDRSPPPAAPFTDGACYRSSMLFQSATTSGTKELLGRWQHRRQRARLGLSWRQRRPAVPADGGHVATRSRGVAAHWRDRQPHAERCTRYPPTPAQRPAPTKSDRGRLWPEHPTSPRAIAASSTYVRSGSVCASLRADELPGSRTFRAVAETLVQALIRAGHDRILARAASITGLYSVVPSGELDASSSARSARRPEPEVLAVGHVHDVVVPARDLAA